MTETRLKNFTGFLHKKLPPEITKMWEIAVLGVLWGPGNQCGIPWFFYHFLNFWKFLPLSFEWKQFQLQTVFFFSAVFNTFQEVSSQKRLHIHILLVSGDIDAKNPRKTFHKLYVIFFAMLNYNFFIVMITYGSKLW